MEDGFKTKTATQFSRTEVSVWKNYIEGKVWEGLVTGAEKTKLLK